ncbi:MMPL family transporter [Streptomyces yaizuensis]|uniref:MMPL family transporter n=1 Tax=Streptomyces yaizuensis TaxID=2989713 RepID=A0ABQ5NWR5_9ACTN|nr:efflux RND transporter permease subunit [Streptomyces sp. YSPA8]GLF94814.1 MMPL family transporter [Streptomyces sp. YSPA8]
MAAVARWCVRHRLVTVLLWVLVCAGTALGALTAGTAYSNDYDVPGTESGRAAALLAKGFPGQDGDSDTVVWHTERGSARDPQVREPMNRMLADLAALPSVASVTGPYRSGGEAQVSPDGRTAYATVTYEQRAADLAPERIDAVVDTARAAASEGIQVETGGPAAGRMQTPGGHTAEMVGVAVAAVVLFLAFGSLAASLLPIVTALISVGTAYAGTVLLGHAMTVADFAPMLGLLVGLGVGIDYALFIVTRHRRGLRAGLPVDRAAHEAVTTTGRAVVFAGATVCIALLGMLVLRLDFLDGVAISASLTVVCTVAASVTLLPALLSLIGERALSGRERRALREHGPRPDDPTSGLAARWSAVVERRPRLLGAVATVLMAVLALPALSLHLGTSDQGNHPAGSTTRAAYDLLAHGGPGSAPQGGGFGPGVNGPLTLVARIDGPADRAALDRLPAVLADTRGVASTGPVVHNRAGDTALLTVVPTSSPQSKATSDLVDRLRTEVLPAATGDTGPRVYVGGVTAGYDDFAALIIGKLPPFVGVVIGLGSLLLLLAFRSFAIPLKAAAMNVAAVAAAFGVVVAVFQWGWGSEPLGLGAAGPVEPFLPVIMVSVLFGLSMDYQVFLVGRMYEEWLATGDNRRAVRVGLAETGRVINSAAVIMISVFLAFVLTGDRIIAMFGIALAAAVALDAFVLRTLLVPALMHLLGGANWWLPRSLDRLLPRITIEPPATGEPRPAGEPPADEARAKIVPPVRENV